MRRYLVVFISEDQFLCEPVEARSLAEALNKFLDGPLGFDEVYSITRAS
jgi:hypothetical protein